MGLSNGTNLTATPSSLILQARYSGLSYTSVSGGAFFAAVTAAGGSVSPGRQTLINNLISGMQADGVYSLVDNLWLDAAENYQSGIIDIKGLVQATPVGMGAAPYAGNFTVDRGFTTSATAYLNLGAGGGPNCIQNSAMFGFAKRTNNITDAIISMGTTNTSGGVITYLAPKFSDTFCYAGVNVAAAPASAGFADTSGNFMVSRTAASGAASTVVYQGGASSISLSDASAGIPNQNFALGGYIDSTGTFSNGGSVNTQQFSAAYIGGGMTAAQVALFNARLQTYLTAVGA